MSKMQNNCVFVESNTKLPRYLPYPEFLLRTEISLTARQVYAMLLDRTTLSQKNGWVDENGSVFVIYTIKKIADATGKCVTTIKHALKELSDRGLIERRRNGFNMPNMIFAKLPVDGQETNHQKGKKLTVKRSDSCLLSTEYNNKNSNHCRSGKKGGLKQIPDYHFEEETSL